jgi:hypothetical protein
VDSVAFAVLLEKNAKVLVFFEVLMAGNPFNPVSINLGDQFAISGLELDLGRGAANRISTKVNGVRDE